MNEKGETKCKEYLNQYPNSAGLKFTVAGLINMYSMMLEDDFKELTNSFVDPMVLYASLLESEGKNKDAEDLCKKVLLSYLIKSTTMMSILSRIYKDADKFDKSVLYLNAVNQIESMFKIGLCSGAYDLCKLYIQDGKKEIAAKWFNN